MSTGADRGTRKRKEKRRAHSSTAYSVMDTRPVGFIDSGIGGLHYLYSTKKLLPHERMVYVADTAHFPYGKKSHDEIRRIVSETVGKLIAAEDPKVIVVACNTASVAALDFLRERYSVPFIGVVPAVKPAAEKSKGRKIGVLATSRTVEDNYTAALIDTFASDCIVTRNQGSGLVDFVENCFLTADEQDIKKQVTAAVNAFDHGGIDTLVLGCTHFTFLEPYFREILGPEIIVIDSRDGVSNRVVSVLRENALFGENRLQDLFYCTSPDLQGKYKMIAKSLTFHLSEYYDLPLQSMKGLIQYGINNIYAVYSAGKRYLCRIKGKKLTSAKK